MFAMPSSKVNSNQLVGIAIQIRDTVLNAALKSNSALDCARLIFTIGHLSLKLLQVIDKKIEEHESEQMETDELDKILSAQDELKETIEKRLESFCNRELVHANVYESCKELVI